MYMDTAEEEDKKFAERWLAASVKRDGRLKAFRAFRAVKDRSLTALNTSHFTDVMLMGPSYMCVYTFWSRASHPLIWQS
jgi:hypothetical protein